MPRQIEAVIKTKGAPTKNWVHMYINEHTFQKANNSLQIVLWSILICWDGELVGFVKCEPKSSQLKQPKT